MEREEVRELIRSHRPSSGTGYPEEVRRVVVTYTQQCRAQGQHWAHIGSELGLSSTTLVNWSQPQGKFLPIAVDGPAAETAPAQPQGKFLPVAVVDRPAEETATVRSLPSPTSGLVLHTPAGFRLEGLDLQQALAVLQVLR